MIIEGSKIVVVLLSGSEYECYFVKINETFLTVKLKDKEIIIPIIRVRRIMES